MDFVNIDTLIEFLFYDEETQQYKKTRGTVKEFLEIFCDFRNIPIYSISNTLLGVIYEKDTQKLN